MAGEMKPKYLPKNKHRHRKRFDDNAPKYKTCFGLIHVRGAAIAVGVFELICILLLTAALIYIPIHGHSSAALNPLLTAGFVGIVVGVINVIVLLYGLIKIKPFLILPHVGVQLLAILVMYLFSTIMIAALATEDPDLMALFSVVDFKLVENDEILKKNFTIFISLMVVFLIVVATIEIWLVFVIYWAYHYLIDAEAAQAAKNADTLLPMV